MHFALGVYAPLTYNSAVKAGVGAEQFSLMSPFKKLGKIFNLNRQRDM